MNVAAKDRPRSMWRRTALVVGSAALISLIVACAVRMHEIAGDRNELVSARINTTASSFARELSGRIEQADALARYLTAADSGAGAVALRERMLSVDAFRGVTLSPPGEFAAGDDAALSADQRLRLKAGDSVLQVAAPEAAQPAVYLLRLARAASMPALARFEFDPAWLWRGVEDLPQQDAIVVVDPAEHRVFEGTALPPEIVHLFARAASEASSDGRALLRDWQQDGAPWRAAVVRVDLNSARVSAAPWTVVAYGKLAPLRLAALPLLRDLLPLLLLAAASVWLATWYLARRWQAVLMRLDAALQALQQGQFPRVSLQGAADTPRTVAQSYNLAIIALEGRWSAQQQLAEIDRLLLDAADLEQSIEPILQRVCALTSAPLAALALLDRDAPGHARSFMATADGMISPVSRVNLDPEMALGLQDMAQGIGVQPHHLERFSFLQPLQACGAEFCHVWPLFAGSELAALLSVGYRSMMQPAEELLRYGAQCTSRLQVALSNRDCDARLYRQAHFDSLTSLPNRVLFRDRLSQELAGSADGAGCGALLYVDLDHFKRVNDSVGHIAGDQLLTIVAQRLRSCVKDGDTVARLGGDEFAIILRQVPSAEAASEIAQRIIETLQRPVNIAGRDHQVRASIGITRFPADGDSIEQLLRNADLAMYQAKDSGRSRAVLFDSRMARASIQLAESGLFRAVRRREFALYYQPQYALQNGELVALEALVRWQHPREGLRFPKDFVPAAEQSGLIVEIGTWVLESACRQLALWREQGIAPGRLALNVALQQLRAADFLPLVSDTLARMRLPPQLLELEVTEAVFADDEARQALQQLAALGVRVALDDFGSGYSSLNYLRQYPVDAIKIDRSFISEVPDNCQATTLLATIIDMAHTLGRQVVAEGVETLPQLDYLRQRGCDVAQGFVLARPLNVADISERLAQRSGSTALLRRAVG
jgi:diguanylate cyclase (GGDEF)-like protein